MNVYFLQSKITSQTNYIKDDRTNVSSTLNKSGLAENSVEQKDHVELVTMNMHKIVKHIIYVCRIQKGTQGKYTKRWRGL